MSIPVPMDVQLNHQSPRPLHVSGTTDRRFYDRDWFEVIQPRGDAVLLCGMDTYQYMGVADGFLAAQPDGQQVNVRFSPRDEYPREARRSKCGLIPDAARSESIGTALAARDRQGSVVAWFRWHGGRDEDVESLASSFLSRRICP